MAYGSDAWSTDSHPRSARGARRREEILDAAVGLFAEKGYRSSSIRDLAAAAGMSQPGLQRHYSSKGDVLLAVIDRFSGADVLLSEPTIAAVDEAGQKQDAVLAALIGEATSRRHPAHDKMRERSTEAVAQIRRSLLARSQNVPGVNGNLDDVAVRFASARDGLELLQRYVPQFVDGPAQLSTQWRHLHEQRFSEAPPRVLQRTPMLPPQAFVNRMTASVEGYGIGRTRRAHIVAAATTLFASEGYGDTSMSDVAVKTGIAKATLFHYYPTKEHLLQAVLVARDAAATIPVANSEAAPAIDLIENIVINARHNSDQAPGLIEVYSVLEGEATPTNHPAHEYFVTRFLGLIESITEILVTAARDGDLPPDREPHSEAVWLVALWDGLQIHHLYHPGQVDVAAHLAAHLNDLLPARATRTRG